MNGQIEDLGIEGIADAVRVGRGGNSDVYKALQTGLDRIVAVKVIRTDLDDTELRHFRREQRAVGRLSDIDGILTVFASGTTKNGDPYLVMPYLEAGSLADQIAKHGPVPWENAVPLMARAARAIHEAHERGVFHGDLKPHNLLLDSNDRAQVVDFGIARLGDGTLSATSASFTPAYAPPELLESTNGPNVRSDVYGLGITLATLLDGRSPFGGKETSGSIALTISNVLTKEPALPADCPSSLKAAVLRATAKDPAARPASALEFAEMLQNVRAEPPDPVDSDQTRRVKRPAMATVSHRPPDPRPSSQAPPPGSLSPTGPRLGSDPPSASEPSPTRRRRWPWAVLAVGLIGLVGVGAWAVLRNDDKTIEPETALPDVAIVDIDGGQAFTCARDETGDVWCWGQGDSGQLGSATTTARATPRRVEFDEGRKATDLSVGFAHSCIVSDRSEVWCWGQPAHGKLDGRPLDGTIDARPDPVLVEADRGFTSVAAGDQHTCALDDDGQAWCWGKNGGRLGNGARDDLWEGPQRVLGDQRFRQLAAGGRGTCGVELDGSVWCWGDLPVSGVATEPREMATRTTAEQVTAADHHFCALLTDGGVVCWGENSSGQLGNNNNEPSAEPVDAVDLDGATHVAADMLTTCATNKSGEALCWGQNQYGQLGLGVTAGRHWAPERVVLPEEKEGDPTTFGLGNDHTCLANGDGWVWCWGFNRNGQAGTDNVDQLNLPTLVEFDP